MTNISPAQGQPGVTDVAVFKPHPGLTENRDIIKAVQAINASSSPTFLGETTHLKFRMDSVSRRPVIEVVDSSNQSVLFQIPPENVLELAKIISEKASSPDAAYYQPSQASTLEGESPA